MKLFHLSDLHLGKRVNEFSMTEDQRYILNEILSKVDSERPDGIMISGDVYDRSVPSTDAVELFDDFLTSLSERSVPVFIISGNHDSPERLSFGNRLMDRSGIHIAPVYDGNIKVCTLQDEYGPLNIFMLPFIKPVHVRSCLDKDTEEIRTYTDTVKAALSASDMDVCERNILMAHQFVTGAERSDSEELSVGGIDNVEAYIFKDFDYVALGHIHRPQNLGERIRYCGSPLKYSFSEASYDKSVTMIEIFEKGSLNVTCLPLKPIRDMKEIKGTYKDIMAYDFYNGTDLKDSYLHITLTDQDDIPDAMAHLQTVYRYLMVLDYDNERTRHKSDVMSDINAEKRTPMELFSDLYKEQNGKELEQYQREFLEELIEKIWENE